jgi:hypothetical protein
MGITTLHDSSAYRHSALTYADFTADGPYDKDDRFDCRDRVANFLEKRSAAALHGLAVPPYIESVVNKVTMELPYKRLIVVARVRDEDAVQNGTPDRINV